MFFRRKQGREPEAESAVSSGPADAASVLRDELGLYHLWYLEMRMREELSRGARIGSVFSLALWQMRQLPGENLDRGHLEKAASTITENLRAYDIAARLETFRFAAILLDAGFEAASTVAFRLKGQLQLKVQTGGRWQAGVACFPGDGVDADAIIQTALRRLESDSRAA